MKEISELVEISKYAGERFDLVQAGGGNSSVKLDNGDMLIKASGYILSDLSYSNGYSRVLTNKIKCILSSSELISCESKRERERITSELVKDATLDKNNRPSIETLLHSLLLKYTLHTHPIVVNIIVVRNNWKDILGKLFKDDSILLVEYDTPGIELAINLSDELKKKKDIPKIIFLQNHGLIVSSSDVKEIVKLTEYVINKIEDYLSIDMERYKLTNKITNFMKKFGLNDSISYLCEDVFLTEQIQNQSELFFRTPFCPDSLVYCGISTCKITNFDDLSNMNEYKKKYFEFPKVVLFENKIFFISSNVKKAKEMEEVLKFHILVLKNNTDNINYLEVEELAYLSNWEAEQFRQKI